jgi:general secretion pathway protein G
MDHKRTRTIRRSIRRGFTLMEIIVVVTIIALLATMVAPRVWRYIGSSKQKVAQAEVKELAKAVRMYCTDNGLSRPPADFELDMLLQGTDPYLNKRDDLVDPWGNDYIFVMPGQYNPDFDIVTYGRDGQPGGEGEDADVHN